MGRGKISISRIDNKTTRQVTFAKRRAGLLKKTHELAVLCDAQIGLIIFSASGKMYEYCSSSMEEMIQRYQLATGNRMAEQPSDDAEQWHGEIRRMREQTKNLQLSMQRYTGEDLSSATMEELDELERMLERSVLNVRTQKIEVLEQQLENLHRKEKMMEHENAQIYHMINEYEGKAATMAAVMMPKPEENGERSADVLSQFPFCGEEQPSSVLQLATLQTDQPRDFMPYRLHPAQPNLQDYSLN